MFGKIAPFILGVTVGSTSGTASFFLGLVILFLNPGTTYSSFLGTLYFNYNLSIYQCFIGAVEVAIHTFIGSYAIAWIYNFLRDKI